MIPYFAQPQLRLGPLTIHAFGVLVACALFVGMRIVRRRAAGQGLPDREVGRFLSWVLIGGFVGAHLVDRLVYFPRETMADPFSLLRFWESLSSFGGFLGGTAGALCSSGARRTRLDLEVRGQLRVRVSLRLDLGRTGCFVAYDHPGRSTGFFSARCTRTASFATPGPRRGDLHHLHRGALSRPWPPSSFSRILLGALYARLCAVPIHRRLPQDR